jgi:MFS family permease
MLGFIYLISFLYAIQVGLVVYINSSFIEQYISVNKVGLVFSLAALLTILTLSLIPRLLRKYGHYKLILAIFALSTLSLFALAWVKILAIILFFFIAREILVTVTRAELDLYLEEESPRKETGEIRGSHLTIMNVAIAISPLLVAFILTGNDYWKIYVLAGIIAFISLILVATRLKRVPDICYDRLPFWKAVTRCWQNRDIRSIFMANFLLRFFFAWMIIYMPIYLHNYVGFDWKEIGMIFSIMLLPYIIFEMPLGKLADRKLGEKELLFAGFIIASLATAVIPFIASTSLAFWAIILLMTRVGASFVEIMTETYFFKKVEAEDTNTIEFFRDSRPLAHLIAPILASAILYFTGLKGLFFVLALITLSGTYFAAQLKDTL